MSTWHDLEPVPAHKNRQEGSQQAQHKQQDAARPP